MLALIWGARPLTVVPPCVGGLGIHTEVANKSEPLALDVWVQDIIRRASCF